MNRLGCQTYLKKCQKLNYSVLVLGNTETTALLYQQIVTEVTIETKLIQGCHELNKEG